MTQTEAQTLADWIHRAFPEQKMEERLYVRALVHYDVQVATDAVLRAIESDWKWLPKVSEVIEVIRSKTPVSTARCATCSGDKLVYVGTREHCGQEYDQYARCPECNVPAEQPRDELDPAKVREMMSQ